MRLYDSHAHFEPDESGTAALLERARTAGVERVLAVGGSAALNDGALQAGAIGAGAVRLALGLDRDQCARPLDANLASLRTLLAGRTDLAALGEIGLDLHYSPETADRQGELFGHQLALADEFGLPVVIHTREADDMTRGILDAVPWHGSGLRGVIHCYTGAPGFAGALLDRGFMVSFSGIVTFRNAETVRSSARYVPDDRLLIETDAPFLSPVPLRGQPNEPAHLVHTAAYLAALRKVPEKQLAALTYANAVELFG
ncbi:MAG: TatD family hydrolase [Kiritimatiellia bacterium]